MQFAELTLPECVHKGITEAGFTECTPIQALSLPITLAGRDVAGQGQTGPRHRGQQRPRHSQ